MADAGRDIAKVASDPEWLAHRHDANADAIHFGRATRETHRSATFLIDEQLPESGNPVIVDRRSAVAAAGESAPIHFIFHSAFCCSTLLARAFDIEGRSMGLKEPVILNDMSGWKHRGGDPQKIAEVLGSALTLLARPFRPGEAIVVKPSNVVTGLIPAMMTIRPQAGALLLYAPLDVYLSSIARKGMWGRLWVRDLFVKLGKDGLINYGFSGEETMRQTDLQIAAIGWLAQHRLFSALAQRFPDRVRTLDSETLLARPREVMERLSALFNVGLDDGVLDSIAGGQVFRRHSKDGSSFDNEKRKKEREEGAALHADELEKVERWADAVASSAGQSLVLPGALLS